MDTPSLEPLKTSDTIISIIEPHETQSPKTKEWVSCCFKMNPSAVKYFTQVSILYLLIIYSCAMIVIDKGCESQRNFSGLLMIAIGTLIPSPKFG